MATTPKTNTEEFYSDFTNNLLIHPIKKDLTRLVNEDSVKRSIKNILLTDYYERRFRPRFGANIRKYLFETITPLTLRSIQNDIMVAIKTYEPRANVIDVKVSAGSDNNQVDVSITFTTINNLQPAYVSATIGLTRVR